MSGKPARRSGVRVYRKGDAGGVPLYWQIHAQLRASIVSGSRQPGDLLPASRALAKELKVGRNTVEAAIAVLVSEGLVERRVGSGTRVAARTAESEQRG